MTTAPPAPAASRTPVLSVGALVAAVLAWVLVAAWFVVVVASPAAATVVSCAAIAAGAGAAVAGVVALVRRGAGTGAVVVSAIAVVVGIVGALYAGGTVVAGFAVIDVIR